MKVRAKMKCVGVQSEVTGALVHVQLTAVTSGSVENEEWAKYTPSANVSIVIAKDKPAALAFEVGMDYYVDFTPVNGWELL